MRQFLCLWTPDLISVSIGCPLGDLEAHLRTVASHRVSAAVTQSLLLVV